MRTLVRLYTRDFLAKDADAAGIGREIAGDQIEQGGFAGAVGSDDEPMLAWHHLERDIVDRGHTAERLLEPGQLQGRCHCLLQRSHQRRTPGTTPSGMKITINTKIEPSNLRNI